MKPPSSSSIWILGLFWLAGCNSPLIRSQSPETEDLGYLTESSGEDVELVGDVTIPLGLNYLKIEGVALVNGLDNRGADPSPSPLRTALISEMQSYDVKGAEDILAKKTNALVVVTGYLPPGVEKGDRFDVAVSIPRRSEATSLEGGYLLRCRLREMRMLNHTVHSGNVSGLARGRVLVDALFEGSDDEVMVTRGRVLGGGQAQVSRPLGLAIRGDSTVRQSAMIGAAINARFHRVFRGDKRGVATPKRDNYIELAIQPRYKHNIARYVRVIRSIAARENAGERAMRIESLERRLLEPTTSARAALQLEAIGEDAAHVLVRGLASSDAEVKFYSAEALAYLDHEEAADVLGEMANREPAFRWRALTALSAMDHVAAYDALTALVHVPSAETRYGAFRALRIRNAADPMVRGESLGGGFAYHIISSNGPPLIHFSRTERPEIVLFGDSQRLEPPAFLFAGKEIMIKGLQDGQLKVSRFGVGGKDDLREICPADVDHLIRAIVKVGGGYGEILHALHEAKQRGYLESKLVVNAVPRPGRKYERDEVVPDQAEVVPGERVDNPIPELFSNRLDQPEPDKSPATPGVAADEESGKKDGAHSSFMGRMTGWFRR